MTSCPNCGQQGDGKYCSECGHAYIVKRITLPHVLHEVAHTFTHFDKGFLYTLKQLATKPGTMQKRYLKGERSKHQKPFSMFFICTTIAGLAFYWISLHSQVTNLNEAREHFFRHYFVILQAALLPYYTLVIWLIFDHKNFNYAETLVLFVYTLSFAFLLIIPLNLIHVFAPFRIRTDYIELILMAGYTTWTNLNFFDKQPAWLVIIKNAACLLICYYTSTLLADQIVYWMSNK